MSHVDGVDDGVSYGVRGQSSLGGDGVLGISNVGDPPVAGVRGHSSNGIGVYGSSDRTIGGAGVYGESNGVRSRGVFGNSVNSIGVQGRSELGRAMWGHSDFGTGIQGSSNSATGVYGSSFSSYGVRADSVSGIAVEGMSRNWFGVSGVSTNFIGVYGEAAGDNQAGVLGITTNKAGIGVAGTAPTGSGGFAGYFTGDVKITGNLQKGGGSFKIDHPLDPANKYLYHSFVESPDMKNIYDGVIVLNDNGEAEIELPDWFGALNKDFRYQLTAIGAPGPNLYIAEEISDVTSDSNNNSSIRFKIAGGTPGMKVSWNITGIRKDPSANAHRIQVEEDKPDKERGQIFMVSQQRME
jgi:hypothetical protein